MQGFTKLGSFLNLRLKVEKAAKAGCIIVSQRGDETRYDLEGYRIVVTPQATTLWQSDSYEPLRDQRTALREVEGLLKHRLAA